MLREFDHIDVDRAPVLRSARVAGSLNGAMRPPAFALAAYSDSAAELLVDWKEHGYRRANSAMSVLMNLLVVDVRRRWGRVTLVPVPALRSSALRRGALPLQDLVAAAGRDHGMDVVQPLARRSRIDQVGLGLASRKANAREGFTLKAPSMASTRRAVVIDDVITTGATLVTCGQLLTSVGWHVDALVAPFARELVE